MQVSLLRQILLSIGIVGALAAGYDGYAQVPLNISAESIEYNYREREVVASQSVSIIYRGMTLTTHQINYSPIKNTMNLPEPFTVQNNDSTINGQTFYYDYIQQYGQLECLDSRLGRTHIYGEVVTIQDRKIQFDDARFSTCNKGKNSVWYEIRSESLSLFPEFGFFIASNNKIKLSVLPFEIWIPTFIYGSGRYSLISQASGLPEIGSSEREGIYLKQRFAYIVNNSMNGSLDIGYQANLGGYFGGVIRYQVQEDIRFNLAAHLEGTDGYTGLFRGDMNISSWFGNDINDQADIALDQMLPFLYEDGDQLDATLSVIGQYRELIQNVRLSYIPAISIGINNAHILNEIELDLELSYGHMKEEIKDDNDRESDRSTVYTHLEYPVVQSDIGGATLEWSGLYNGYNNQSWTRSFAIFRTFIDHPLLRPEIAYYKQLNRRGGPYFVHERIAYASEDEIELTIAALLGVFKIDIEGFYEINREKWRQLNIQGTIDYGCWSTGIIWKSVENQIGVIVSFSDYP